MPDKVTLVRQDGTLLEATPEQASRLALLGYREQTSAEDQAQAASDAKSDYYTSASQKLSTALEGVGAGATFGATDYLFGDEDTKLRAQYNPGTRMATEALGAFAPMLLSDGATGVASATSEVAEASSLSKAARFAPTNLLADAAKSLAPGAAGSLTKAVLAGAIEGGAYSGAGTADHVYLDGDPVTAEAVLHGIGWGAVIGGALAGVGHGIEAVGKHEQAAVAAEQAAKDAELASATKAEAARVARLNEAEQARYQAQLEKAKAGVRESVPVGALRSSAGAEYEALHSEVSSLADSLKVATKTADESVAGTISAIVEDGQTAPMGAFKTAEWESSGAVGFMEETKKVGKLYEAVTKAVNRARFDEAEQAAAAYTSHVASVAKKLNMELPNPGKAIDELILSRRVAKELSDFPRSVEEFARLSAAKLETTIASLERVKGLPYDNVPAIQTTAQDFSKALGIEGQDLRSTWQAAKQLHKSEGTTAKEVSMPRPPRVYEPKPIKPSKAPITDIDETVGKPSLGRKILGYAAGGKAYVAARGLGASKTTAYAGYLGVKNAVTNGGKDLMVVRAAVVAKIKQAAASYLPSAGQALKVAAPRVEPLSRSLFGEDDKSTKDRKQLALNRVKEINEFAPTASDSIYRALEPLSATQPHLTPAMHASALTAFQALQELAPKDPGVLSGLKSIWKPSELYATVLSKQLAVFHDPVGEASMMLQTGGFDPIKIEAMKEMAPNTWANLRVELLQRISQPGVLDRVSYRDQIGLSTMLDLPIHSSMAPEYIATSQQMFLERSQPLKASPRQSQGGGLPDISKNPNTTSSQRSDAR
jgi:hypothetical protein